MLACLEDFKHSCDYIYCHLFVNSRSNKASIVQWNKWCFPRPHVQWAEAIPGNGVHAQLLNVGFCHWVGYLGPTVNFLEGNQMEKGLLWFGFSSFKWKLLLWQKLQVLFTRSLCLYKARPRHCTRERKFSVLIFQTGLVVTWGKAPT